MATPPSRNTANTNATAAKATLQSDADSRFISDAGDAILSAISFGKLSVTLSTFDNCDLQALHDYFVGLGYAVSYPGLAMLPGSQPAFLQPAELFGIFWAEFWAGNNVPHLHNPVRLTLSWRTP